MISAITGGVFSFVRVFSVSATLLTTPAYILASYIIEENIGSMTDPADSGDWPLYISYMPDGFDIETDCGSIYDTSGIKDGRLMIGPVIEHYGIQLKIRSDVHITGWSKAEAIASALDGVVDDLIEINSVEYRIYNIKRTGPVISLGMELGTKGRRLFTVNFLVTLKRVTG